MAGAGLCMAEPGVNWGHHILSLLLGSCGLQLILCSTQAFQWGRQLELMPSQFSKNHWDIFHADPGKKTQGSL
jgi:hypothetical protein